jgi:hypothetical protein
VAEGEQVMNGRSSVELEFTFTFAPDGNEPKVDRIAIARRGSTEYDLVPFGDDEKLFNLLPEATREQLIAEAWEEASIEGAA